ncbi:MAG: thioesterase domain-containing protein, partial [Anaerolineae bacterium]|nr:thioesterase domain-containing protein [Anaerolineae bacterium]
ENEWTALVDIQPNGSNPPFFCVHGATGDILWFRELARHLGPDQPFYGLQSIGLDGVREPLTSVEEMARHYLAEVRVLQPDGPYHLGGYCFGGNIAYEMAQQLQAEGQAVAFLAMLSSEPYTTGFNDVGSRLGYLKGLANNLPHWLSALREMEGHEVSARTQRKARRFWRERIRQVDHLRANDVIEHGEELPPHRQRIIELNSKALANYRFKPYHGHIHVYQPQAPSLLAVDVPGLGWQHLASSGITLKLIPGSHQSIFKEPRVRYFAEQLGAALAEVYGEEIKMS